MKYTKKRILNALGNRTGFTKMICTLFELQKEPAKKHQIKSDKVFGVFQDSHGNRIELLSGLRDRIKPAWRSMVNPVNTAITVPPYAKMNQTMAKQKRALTRIENFLQTHTLSFVGKEVLEIGAYEGSSAYAFAEFGAKSVLATDMAAYYINQSPGGVVSQEAVASKNAELKQIRDAYSKLVSAQAAPRVRFIEDDICTSSVPDESVDVIVSWEVLEHITNPDEAFKQMSRVLKKGGFAFHEYNPFFSVDGGHSLCTLDFPWGHARLDDKDFERYYDELRPDEKAVSLSFFRNNLNRMTLSHLNKCMKDNGLVPLSVIPWYSADDQEYLTDEMLKQCKTIHPTVEHVDLVAPIVWVLCQKK